MLVTLKFIPVLVGEIKQIWEAMKVRGANMNWYRPSCIYRAFIIPLVMRIIGISDTLSLSLETRAFTLDDSTSSVYKVIKNKSKGFRISRLCYRALRRRRCYDMGIAIRLKEVSF